MAAKKTKKKALPPVIERNELSKNSRGGTELMADALLKHVDSELLQNFNIICSRVRTLSTDRKNVLWLHDLPNDPESSPLRDAEFRDKFDALVFVSDWQMEKYNMVLGIPYGGKSIVLKNAIDPIPFNPNRPTDKVKLIYHTTPHRGLILLYPVFEHLARLYPFIELDVYSSFSIYGWDQRDAEFAEVIQKCKDHPQINYHGAVSNDEIRKALQETHIFAFPSIWPETSCLAAIEAAAAGNVVVAPNFAALSETLANFAWSYQWSENQNEHANRFARTLSAAIETVKGGYPQLVPNLNFQSDYYNHFYGWPLRKSQWEHFLKGML